MAGAFGVVEVAGVDAPEFEDELDDVLEDELEDVLEEELGAAGAAIVEPPTGAVVSGTLRGRDVVRGFFPTIRDVSGAWA